MSKPVFALIATAALCGCSIYHAADPAHPPAETAYWAEVGCRIASGEPNGLLPTIAWAQSGGEQYVRDCMTAKGFVAPNNH